jgi:cytidylate kinase
MKHYTTKSEVPVVTVDGPSGVGKGTISQRLAARLGWHLLDSGALYRLTGLAARRRGIDLGDEPAVAKVAIALDVRFAPGLGEIEVFLDDQEVTGAIRTEACGNDASRVAALGSVREALLGRQRAFRQPPGLIADGRDMGTTVFPGAPAKIFLTASVEVRAERRYKQLIEKGLDVSLGSLLQEIAERDERDRTRSVSPLIPADDAVIIDTSELDADQVFERVMGSVGERVGFRP